MSTAVIQNTISSLDLGHEWPKQGCK